MVEGVDTTSREPEGNADTLEAVGLGQQQQDPPQQPAAAVAADGDDSEREMLLNKLAIPRHLPSIIEIKRALPQHVFDPRVSTSMLYALKDAAQVAVTFLVAEWLWSSSLLPAWSLLLLLPAYWMLQGTFFTALFVVGHDAGHSSFSHHGWLNDVVGYIFHTFLLCPYYCWKLSHRIHHKNTGNIDKDEVFYPIRKKEYRPNTTLPGFGLGIGWFAYLLVGYGPRPINHFNPMTPVLRRRFFHCALSVSLVLLWAGVLWRYVLAAGFWKLCVHYLVPDLVFASYTVVITFLHHTEEEVPWYTSDLWDNVRGQLSSVDRHYGWCHGLIHSIGTHQIHHLFTKVPHYHLEEATRAFRARFPQLVQVREDAILPAFWRMFVKYLVQRVVPDNVKVHLYK